VLRYTIENVGMDAEEIKSKISDVIRKHGLNTASLHTLKSIPGSIHWHVKKGKEKGLLEITYVSKQKQVWVDIHDNRRSDWNLRLIESFTEAIRKEL
jgi:hypothetical protein